MYWLQTVVEQQHFPFYEMLWLFMLGLWWSVINRLKRIEENQKRKRQLKLCLQSLLQQSVMDVLCVIIRCIHYGAGGIL